MHKKIILATILLTTCLFYGCKKEEKGTANAMYEIQKAPQAVTIDANWDKDVWKNIPAITLDLYMGDKPQHRPKTQAKLLYDDEAVYVIFRVEDQYVRAVAREFHDSVCSDSCVEFFFSPDKTVETGYFNLEMNCGGTILLHFNPQPRQSRELDIADCQKIEVAHTLPKNIEPEISEPTTWSVEYCLPLAILEKYGSVTKPAPGVVWRANFYKCADQSSRPHWLTWNKVDHPSPNFHLPQFFGQIKFK